MYKLVFKKQASKYYLKSPSNIKAKLNRIFDALSAGKNDQLDIKPLKGEFSGVFRIRSGNLRIFVRFSSKDTLDILIISPRGDAY